MLIAETSKRKSIRIRRSEEWTNQIYLINIYRTLHATTAKCIFFSSLHNTFTKIHRILFLK